MTMKERLTALPVVGTLMAVQKRTKADAADQFGAALAFHAFVSLFPLVAVAVAITGWLLADQPEQVAEVVNAIQRAIPGLEGEAIDNVLANVIDNSGSIGLFGFLGALYTGLRVTNAAQTATQFVFGVKLEEVSALKARAQQVGSLFALGFLAIAGVAVSAWVQSVVLSDVPGVLVPLGGLGLSALLDVLLFWTAYRIYSLGAGVGWKDLLPGALLGGIGWTALKYFGGAYLGSQVEGSVVTTDGGSAATLLLATMIGLLLVFYLAGRLYVYGAELSAELIGVGVRHHGRDDSPEEEADDDPADDRPVRHASGDREGLLAALTAHEQRRGLSGPQPSAAPESAPSSPSDGNGAATSGGGGPEGDGHGGDEDLVVTIDHDPDDAPPDDATDHTADEAHAAWARRPRLPQTRELVPFRPPGIATAVTQDPVARRIAIATAVGVVGIAAGILRRRRQG